MIELHAQLARTKEAIAKSMLLLEKSSIKLGQDGPDKPTTTDDIWLSYDTLTVELEAHRLIRRTGSVAASVARENAEAADEIGDIISAEAWRDIADEAQRILERT